MKSLKIIIPIVVVLMVVAVVLIVRKATDHTAEFRDALYARNMEDIKQMLEAHPSLANANNMEDQDRGTGKVTGWTPLHVAATMNNVALINLLAHYHAKTDVKDSRGLTPLLWTAFGGEHDATAALLSNGADINARGLDGRSTLDLAKLSMDTNLVELLRSRGAKE